MPRTWGYIFIAIAALIGVGALLLPIPETIEVAKVEPVEQPKARPTPPAARQRHRTPPKPPPKPAPKAMPRQDTTDARQTVTPKVRPNG